MHHFDGKNSVFGGLRIMNEASPHAEVQRNQSVELLLGGCFGLIEGPLGQNYGPLPASTATPRRRQQRCVS